MAIDEAMRKMERQLKKLHDRRRRHRGEPERSGGTEEISVESKE